MIKLSIYESTYSLPSNFKALDLVVSVGMFAFTDLVDGCTKDGNYLYINRNAEYSDINNLLKTQPLGYGYEIYNDYEIYYQFDKDCNKSLIMIRTRYRNKLLLFCHDKVHKAIKRATTHDGVIRSLCTHDIINVQFRKGINIDMPTASIGY